MTKTNSKQNQVKKSPDASKPQELIVLPQSNSYLDQLDSPKKRDFILLYTKLNGNITNTCIGIGIVKQTYYNWLEADKTFALAVAEAESALNDEIRELLIQQAANGEMSAIIFYLKKRHPDFKDQGTNVAVQVNVTPILEDKAE